MSQAIDGSVPFHLSGNFAPVPDELTATDLEVEGAIPRGGSAAEDEGWVIPFVYDEATHASELAILDAARFDASPVATVKLPRRVPFGFHGSWVPDPA